MNMSTLCTIKNMNRSHFSKARYMIGVGFKILGRTPVPKLPPSYPRSYMQANPEQFQAIRVRKKTHNMDFTLKVSGTHFE